MATDCEGATLTGEADSREVIPSGQLGPFPSRHLAPIAKFLIERGHKPIDYWDNYGFAPSQGRMECALTRTITEEDWAAINEHFVLPRTIWYLQGMIRDDLNSIDFLGYEEVTDVDGVISAEEWESRQDWSALKF